MYAQKTEFFVSVKRDGTYSYHPALRGQISERKWTRVRSKLGQYTYAHARIT